jgi:catechol 2,3-dioxygenase-like lactoylglutathione lyase family enzyme
MTLKRMEHIGIIVDDLASAIAFFAELGLELQGEMALDNPLVGRIVGLDGARTEVAMMQVPDGNGGLELIKFNSPPNEGDNLKAPANTRGIRHLAFVVEDIESVLAGLQAQGGELVGELVNYEDSYWLCYVRGPAGVIVELAEKVG